MTRDEAEDWLKRYGAAWEAGDPDAAAALFTDDAVYRETPFADAMVGRAEIGRYWQEGAADAQRDVTFSSQVWAVNGDVAVAGWQARFTRAASGVRVELDGAFRLVFSRAPGGLRCSRLEEWWHRREG
jgi:ketosteroid isomerase-like protein